MDALRADRNPCQNIPNSFGSTYTITPADAGHAIEVGVVATNDAGSSFTAASAPTETISSTPTTRFDLRGIMPAAVLAHWDGATSGESSGPWSEIRDPFMSLVGIADGNGAWNLILTPGCPGSLGPILPCGATNITGM